MSNKSWHGVPAFMCACAKCQPRFVLFAAAFEVLVALTPQTASANVQLGLDVQFTPTGKLGLSYQGLLSGGTRDNALRADLSWSFWRSEGELAIRESLRGELCKAGLFLHARASINSRAA